MQMKYSVAALAILVSGLAMAGREDRVLLRRLLEPNAVSKYRFEMASKQTVTMPDGSPMPETAYSVSMDYLVKNGPDVSNGKVPVDITVSNYEFSGSDTPAKDRPKEMTMHGLLDDRNSISEIRFDNPSGKYKELMEASMQVLQSHWSLPEQPVKTGDTWEVTLPTSGTPGKKSVTFKMRFDGERKIEGKSFWVLSAKESIPLDVDLGPAEVGGQASGGDMTLKGDMSVDVEALFDKSGQLHSMLSGLKTDVNVRTPQASGQIHVVADTVSKLTLAQ